MHNSLRVRGLLIVALASLVATAHAETPQAEIVVAMRYPQQTGTSHAHLYLYRADGKLLRQLTNDNADQDSDPVFAPGGDTIVFTRTSSAETKECWSIQPRGGGLQKIDAPAWYNETKSSPSFEHIYNGPPILPEPRPAPSDARTITTPDGQTQASIVPAAGQDSDTPGLWDVMLKTHHDAKPVKVGEMGGFSAGFLSRADDDASQCVLQDGALCVAFCFVHLNSSDGNTVYALDLTSRELTDLSPNFATPIPLPGEPAFLTLTENRYVPFGDGKRTSNSSYVERWNRKWKAVRYARSNAAGICYGASMYRPGMKPTTINIRLGSD